jgi:putative transposase
MRLHGIASKIKRKFKITTHSDHKRPVVANLIKGQFTAPAPDKVWTSDITYIGTKQGWLYLSVFLDVFSRRIVGWGMKTRMTYQPGLDAFRQAHILA